MELRHEDHTNRDAARSESAMTDDAQAPSSNLQTQLDRVIRKLLDWTERDHVAIRRSVASVLREIQAASGHDPRVICPTEVDVKTIEKSLGAGWVRRLAENLRSTSPLRPQSLNEPCKHGVIGNGTCIDCHDEGLRAAFGLKASAPAQGEVSHVYGCNCSECLSENGSSQS